MIKKIISEKSRHLSSSLSNISKWGYHSGNDDPTIFLRLYTSAYEYTNLCTGDTRGFNPGNTTNTSLYSIFSIPSIGNEHPFIQVFTKIHVNIAYSMINVIWFPFGSSYKEAD